MRAVEEAKPLTTPGHYGKQLDAAAVVKSWDATAAVIKDSMKFGEDLIKAMDDHKTLMEAHMHLEGRRSLVTRLFVLLVLFVQMALLQAAVSRFETEQAAQREMIEQRLDAAPTG